MRTPESSFLAASAARARTMGCFARTRVEYFDYDLYDALTNTPGALDALDEKKLRALSWSAAKFAADGAYARGECAHAAIMYTVALRALQFAPFKVAKGERRVRRIELRVKLGDAFAGAKSWRSSAGAYAAALRDAGLIAKKRVYINPDDVDDSSTREWNDGLETVETYDDGGDESKAVVREGAKTMSLYLEQCNARESKASIKGIFTPDALFRIGEGCHRAGRYGRAILMYETALTLQPDGPLAKSTAMVWLECGEMHFALHNPEAAITYFTKVLKCAQDAALSSGDVLCEIAKCYDAMNQPVDAERCMARVRDDPKSAPVRLTNRIWVAWNEFEKEQNTTKALKILKEVNEIKRTPEGLYALGRVYANLSQFDAADACFMEACELDPTSPKIWLEIGTLYLKGFKLPDIAVKAFGRARELATALKLKEGGCSIGHGYGTDVEGLTKHTDAELVSLENDARMFSGDTFQELGRPSHALREYEACIDSARIQIRKLKIIIWAVVLLQRAFRAHRERRAKQVYAGAQRVVLEPVVMRSATHEEHERYDAFQRRPRPKKTTEAAKKYDMMRVRKQHVPIEQKDVMELMKDFSLGTRHGAVPPPETKTTKTAGREKSITTAQNKPSQSKVKRSLLVFEGANKASATATTTTSSKTKSLMGFDKKPNAATDNRKSTSTLFR